MERSFQFFVFSFIFLFCELSYGYDAMVDIHPINFNQTLQGSIKPCEARVFSLSTFTSLGNYSIAQIQLKSTNERNVVIGVAEDVSYVFYLIFLS